MQTSTVGTTRRVADPLAWGVLVALAAVAALLLTQVGSVSSLISPGQGALRLEAASQRSAPGAQPSTQGATASTTSSSGSSSPRKIAVKISGYAFSPANLTINVGDTVTWTAQSGDHTATSYGGTFDSDAIAADSQPHSYTFEFQKAGIYRYYCREIPGMAAQVTVNDPAGPPPTYESSTTTTSPPLYHPRDGSTGSLRR